MSNTLGPRCINSRSRLISVRAGWREGDGFGRPPPPKKKYVLLMEKVNLLSRKNRLTYSSLYFAIYMPMLGKVT